MSDELLFFCVWGSTLVRPEQEHPPRTPLSRLSIPRPTNTTNMMLSASTMAMRHPHCRIEATHTRRGITVLPPPRALSLSAAQSTTKPAAISAAESDVLDAIANVKGRGKGGMDDASTALLERAVSTLESSNAGVKDPTKSELLEGKWRLLYTTRPSSASPIQRSFVGVDGFSVFQEVTLKNGPRVNNIVDFGPSVGFLKVEAAASTDQQPLEDFTPRKGKVSVELRAATRRRAPTRLSLARCPRSLVRGSSSSGGARPSHPPRSTRGWTFSSTRRRST